MIMPMKPHLALIAALLLVPAVAMAQGMASHDPSSTQAGKYRLEPAHTQVMFSLSHLGFSQYYGRFSGASGSLDLNPANLGATRLDVTTPTASVSTTSAKLDGELKSPAWLDAAQYPEMRFRSSKVTSLGAGHARIDGELTLHGVTRPLTLDAHFVGAGMNPMSKTYTVGFQATGELKRGDFGVKTFLPMVGDEVDLVIAAAFERVPS